MTEEWRAIPDFPGYEASDLGRVKSHRGAQPRILKQSSHRGYPQVAIHTTRPDGSHWQRTTSVHHLVLMAFVGPRPEGMLTRHLDGDPGNNALVNLTYGTTSENLRDAVRHGTHAMSSKTACVHGHPYDDTNTAYTPTGGRRRCLTCRRIHNQRITENRQALRSAS